MSNSSCASILLAAGASTRLGRPKQLVNIQGETLLRRTARMALEAGCSPVIVVLGFAPEAMLEEVQGLAVVTRLNDEWQQGMSTSLRAGLREIEALRPQPANALLLVCDQPKLTTEILSTLLNAHQTSGRPITACEYAGALGVPAIFSSEIFPELLALTGDQGARRVIARDAARVSSVPFPDGAWDIDTPDDMPDDMPSDTPGDAAAFLR